MQIEHDGHTMRVEEKDGKYIGHTETIWYPPLYADSLEEMKQILIDTVDDYRRFQAESRPDDDY